MAASAYQGVTIFEPETNRITNTLHGWKVDDGSDFQMSGFPATVSHLAFEDSGRWMACESAEVLTCWDFSGSGPTGRAGVVLTGHQATVSAFSWVPGNCRTLISGDAEGNVLVWKIAVTTRPGDELHPAGGVRDDDPVTAITTGRDTAYIARRSGRIDALTVT